MHSQHIEVYSGRRAHSQLEYVDMRGGAILTLASPGVMLGNSTLIHV